MEGKYAFLTRPMDDFIETGSGGGIGFGLCGDITHPVIDEKIITSPRRYHTITESKNGSGAVPVRTDRGWIHIAHGVRNTAAGLRYVIYAFATDLKEPWCVIAEPGGYLIAPLGRERVGDVSYFFLKEKVSKRTLISLLKRCNTYIFRTVTECTSNWGIVSNVVFTNGAVVRESGEVYIYYASSDTRLHVATTTLERLTDYVFNTPPDMLRSADCVRQRCGLIKRNLEYLEKCGGDAKW